MGCVTKNRGQRFGNSLQKMLDFPKFARYNAQNKGDCPEMMFYATFRMLPLGNAEETEIFQILAPGDPRGGEKQMMVFYSTNGGHSIRR